MDGKRVCPQVRRRLSSRSFDQWTSLSRFGPGSPKISSGGRNPKALAEAGGMVSKFSARLLSFSRFLVTLAMIMEWIKIQKHLKKRFAATWSRIKTGEKNLDGASFSLRKRINDRRLWWRSLKISILAPQRQAERHRLRPPWLCP